MLPDHATCYKAILARDSRFDGRLFVGVLTTGIYCRPICPARPPKSGNIIFYPSAAAAQASGLRPCLRCRPETAPSTPAWRGTAAVIGRALRLIDEGALDGQSVEALANRLGLGERQLRRLFRQHVGASPQDVAQTRRTGFAKQLLHETRLPMAQVALASGFGSIRRFNEVFQAVFQRPPLSIRRGLDPEGQYEAGADIVLRAPYRPPLDWAGCLAFLAMRQIKGLEDIQGDTYQRSFCFDGHSGTFKVRPCSRKPDCLTIAIGCETLASLPKVMAGVRNAFDLGSDTTAIGADLSADCLLAPLVAARPGLRVLQSWARFEGVVRAIIGQQISVLAARRLLGLLVNELGAPLPKGLCAGGAMTRLFPTPERVALADLSFLPMPQARRATLAAVAAAFVAHGPDWLEGKPDEVRARLAAIAGIGPWTVEYVALRVLGDPDACPVGDAALLRSLSRLLGRRMGQTDFHALSQAWSPWRAYGAQHVWAALGD
ncbi:MAG: hypothetical protein RL186_1800 [Pseudomonadota bacterium]|jgi:AraC family transcriptional regulator of adaptative response / DNA-3-methyladenine glycosylase II